MKKKLIQIKTYWNASSYTIKLNVFTLFCITGSLIIQIIKHPPHFTYAKKDCYKKSCFFHKK